MQVECGILVLLIKLALHGDFDSAAYEGFNLLHFDSVTDTAYLEVILMR